ncbi:M48 family metallopeptidase [Anaeromyxobacter terrae]|uniref:M48 family metallopeptidase n=1 Tax=Anaeromyxobacter terrae TaxID=2925406 RepID=UPI001F5A83B9|nr:M48 family metallopeptidase [Anaeromyxobacter sp. SG22]
MPVGVDAAGAVALPGRVIDLSQVRHPRERRVLLLSAAANLALVAAAVAAILLAPDWLSAHPQAAQLVRRVRGAAVVAVLIVPAMGFLRLGRWMMIHLNSIRLGQDQLPELHAILERQCRALGTPVPALYVSALPSVGLSDALALRSGTRAIVLGEKLFDGVGDIGARRDVFEFVIGHELGRIMLGHASWWSELLLGYLKRIPVLRLPLVMVQTYSRDRMAALLAPGSLAALAMSASGGEVFAQVNVRAYVRDALAPTPRPAPARLGAILRKEPHLADRVRELRRYGFFRPDAELAGLVPGVRPHD